MTTFAGFMTWMVVGLLTGSLAGIAAKDGGRGLIGDLTLGLGGSLMANMLFQALGGSSEAPWFVVAGIMFIGAAGVIAVQRTTWPRHV
ncbi:MAG TPA: LPXTG cell wall anchor domain-containing protein [Candidatus Methylomirabilis sp.]|nr:LPXTG cell wall anchor domain-containing protein [Candidatus Methylomirabilis sp.]